jgi:hypothetical protein
MEYKGHKLTIERHFYMDELEETYFEVKNPDGTFCHLDWSGYAAEPTQEDFALWIDLGKPQRDHEAIIMYKEVTGLPTNVSSPLNRSELDIIERWQKTGLV